MQETRYNYFGSNKRSTPLLQAKIGKHECRYVTAMFSTFRKNRSKKFMEKKEKDRNTCKSNLLFFVINYIDGLFFNLLKRKYINV